MRLAADELARAEASGDEDRLAEARRFELRARDSLHMAEAAPGGPRWSARRSSTPSRAAAARSPPPRDPGRRGRRGAPGEARLSGEAVGRARDGPTRVSRGATRARAALLVARSQLARSVRRSSARRTSSAHPSWARRSRRWAPPRWPAASSGGARRSLDRGTGSPVSVTRSRDSSLVRGMRWFAASPTNLSRDGGATAKHSSGGLSAAAAGVRVRDRPGDGRRAGARAAGGGRADDWIAFGVLLAGDRPSLTCSAPTGRSTRARTSRSRRSSRPCCFRRCSTTLAIALAFLPESIRTRRTDWYIVVFNVANFVAPRSPRGAVFDAVEASTPAWVRARSPGLAIVPPAPPVRPPRRRPPARRGVARATRFDSTAS